MLTIGQPELMRFFFFLILIWQSHAIAQTNIPAQRANELFFERCLTSLIVDEEIPTDGLIKLPMSAALSVAPMSQGQVWMAKDAHVSLSRIKQETKNLVGCQVRWHSMSAKGLKIDNQVVISKFDRWADEQVARDNFFNVQTCGDRKNEYMRTLESQMGKSTPVRIVISTISELDFLILIAAESPISEPPIPCK